MKDGETKELTTRQLMALLKKLPRVSNLMRMEILDDRSGRTGAWVVKIETCDAGKLE